MLDEFVSLIKEAEHATLDDDRLIEVHRRLCELLPAVADDTSRFIHYVLGEKVSAIRAKQQGA